MKLTGIIGYGEIGKSIEKLYVDFPDKFVIRKKDVNWADNLDGIEILNVAVPFIENFVDIVCKEIIKYSPKLTIIHSTVSPGTTKKIGELTNKLVVHSPVIGVHPNLCEGIKTFTKYVGHDKCTSGELEAIKQHFDDLELNYELIPSSQSTELAKLLSTTYYGLCIAWHGEMQKLCSQFDVDFDFINNWTENYNKGYIALGKENVVRPVLFPPDRIGGHCVVPNTKILSELMESEAFKLILKYS